MMERMRSLMLITGLLVAVACTPDLVSAATCPSICSTKSLWGYGSQAINYQPCECTDPWTGTAKRTGPNCVCDVCYKKEGAHVVGYAKQNGACASGTTDCDACDIASLSGSGSGTKPKTTTPAPSSTKSSSSNATSSSLTPSSSSAASASSRDHLGNSSSTSSKSGAGADADSSSDSSSGMATWQVALVICSCVLVFAVAVMTIMSCYCKTRNQMKDNDTRENETREYEQYWHPGATATAADARPVAQLANSGFGASLTQGGRSSFTSSHSRPNSTKNMPYSEPTYAENDRIGRPAARVSLGSKNDLPQVFNAFPPRDRPSHEVGSRKNIAIEL